MAGFEIDVIGISRCIFHLAETVPDGGKHEALLAPDTGFDPKAHLLQFFPDSLAGADFPGVDQDSDAGAGAEEWRKLDEGGFDRLQGIPSGDQSDRMLPFRNPAGCGGSDPKEATPSQRKIEFHAAAAGDDRAMQARQARETNHGIDHLFLIRNGTRLSHRTLPAWMSIGPATQRAEPEWRTRTRRPCRVRFRAPARRLFRDDGRFRTT